MNIRLPGQYYDAETGLHYNYYRDYSPELGRYIEPGPIGLSGGMNLYAYCAGDPVNREDVWGLVWRTVDIDDHSVYNTLQGGLNQFDHAIRHGMQGGWMGPMVGVGMRRTLTQVWEPDPMRPDLDGFQRYRTTRKIEQEKFSPPQYHIRYGHPVLTNTYGPIYGPPVSNRTYADIPAATIEAPKVSVIVELNSAANEDPYTGGDWTGWSSGDEDPYTGGDWTGWSSGNEDPYTGGDWEGWSDDEDDDHYYG